MINFQIIDDIQVDCIVGFGSACRVAASLKRNNLRFYSNPFDWQMNYSLNVVIELLKNQGKTFYNKCYEDKNYSTGAATGIVDKNNGMISMHDYPKGLPIENAPNYFKKKYGYKFKRLNNILKSAKKICIITYRNITIEEMQNFIKEFGKIYNWEYLYFINIYDTEDEKVEILKENNVMYIQYCFNDEHPNGRNKNQNPDFWLGKIEYWDIILKKISINKKFLEEQNKFNFIFNMIYQKIRSFTR